MCILIWRKQQLSITYSSDGGGLEAENKLAPLAADRPFAGLAHTRGIADDELKRGDGTYVPCLHMHWLAIFPCPLAVCDEWLSDVIKRGLLDESSRYQQYNT